MPESYYVSQYSGEEIDALLGGAGTGTVRYDAAQTLTAAQKTQARANIGAAKSTFLGNISRNQIYKIGFFFAGTGSSNRGAVTLRVCDASSYGSENYMLAFLGDTVCAAEYHGIFEPDLVSKISVYSDPSTTGAAKKYIIFATIPNYGDWAAIYTDHEHSFTRDFVDVTDTFSALVDGLNKEWESVYEYANPPMQLGVEYRTTERYLGKPVYKRTENIGAMPAPGNYKQVQIPYNGDTNYLDNVNICANSITYWGLVMPVYNSYNSVTYSISTNMSGVITLTAASGNTDLSGNGAVYVTVKYTKTTD